MTRKKVQVYTETVLERVHVHRKSSQPQLTARHPAKMICWMGCM